MSPLTFILFLTGLGLLVGGAELLVRGASRLAAALGIPPLIIGLTVVALGTSAPEIAVALQSSLDGQVDLALGNIVGSNIANVLLILGLAALIAPLTVPQLLIRQDVPIMIVTSLTVLVLSSDGVLGWLDGALLIAGIVAYIVYAIYQSRKESARIKAEYVAEFGLDQRQASRGWFRSLAMVLLGLILLIVGAGWLVDGAVAFARVLGVSELIIGLTIVAVGTSLPEVATSTLASIRGERDIAVGNVIGSCIFNLLLVLGLTALVVPSGVPVPTAVLYFDGPVMLATAVACLPIFINGHTIYRWEGGLFLGYYASYTCYLLLASSQHALLGPFSLLMLYFVIPLTVATLLIVLRRSVRSQRQLIPPRTD
ncbi:MAG: calcium/sodium antiporter [Chloroflexota bacterium]|nr:calcium/sodium antiporter [Chloroflexota bacterium]